MQEFKNFETKMHFLKVRRIASSVLGRHQRLRLASLEAINSYEAI